MTIISKAGLAISLGVSRPRVSQYAKSGMPVREDGKIDFEQAVKWITENVVPLNPNAPDKGARRAGRLSRTAATDNPGKQSKAKPSSARSADIPALVSMIFSRAAPRIAEAVVAAGAPLPVAYAAVSIVLMEATEGAQQALEELGYDCGDDGIHFKDRFPVEWGAFADRLLEPVDLEAWERSTRSLAYFADDWQPAQPALRESDAEAAD